MGKNKPVALTWDAFQSLGDPKNPEVQEKPEKEKLEPTSNLTGRVRVYIEKKGRGGKTVTLIKGTDLDNNGLKDLTKRLKTVCGVGGKAEGDNVMVQGDQRIKVIKELLKMGYKDVKNAGA